MKYRSIYNKIGTKHESESVLGKIDKLRSTFISSDVGNRLFSNKLGICVLECLDLLIDNASFPDSFKEYIREKIEAKTATIESIKGRLNDLSSEGSHEKTGREIYLLLAPVYLAVERGYYRDQLIAIEFRISSMLGRLDETERSVSLHNKVRLMHVNTGQWLSSLKDRMYPGGSKQQITFCQTSPNQDSIWIVKSYDGSDDTIGGCVNGIIPIRLEHRESGRNLHSHENPAPITNKNREVTAYGNEGKGDDGDDWIVSGDTQEIVCFGVPIGLTHKKTGSNLFSSFGITHPRLTLGEQEVSTNNENSSDNLWVFQQENQDSIIPPEREGDVIQSTQTPEGTIQTPGLSKYSLDPFTKGYASYAPDRIRYKSKIGYAPVADVLGVGVYANHLAQLIAAKETAMPLSIGLFGAWGAGKSCFIDLIDHNIRNIISLKSEGFMSTSFRSTLMHGTIWTQTCGLV